MKTGTGCGVVLSLLALSGCGLKVNQAKEVATYRKVLDAAAPPASPTLAPGEPLTLEQALLLGNLNNEELAIRGENYLQALIDKNRAVAAFLPTVNTSASFSLQQINGSGGGTRTSFQIPLQGQMNVFNGFQDVANLKRSDAAIRQQRALLVDLQQTFLLNIAQVYYQILRSQRSVEVLESTLKLQEERVRDAETRQRMGLARPLDVAQTQANAAATRVTLVQARSDVRNGRTALAFLIGVPVVDGPLLDQYQPPLMIPPQEQFEQASETDRLDLVAAKEAVEAARQNVNAALGQYLPSVNLSANTLLHSDPSSALSWASTLAGSLPIFSAGLIEANIRTAWSQFRQANLSESQIRRQVMQDVRIAYENVAASRQRLVELQIEVAAAQQALTLADRSYQVGTATNLDRLSAQDTLLNSQLQLASEEFNLKVTYLDLLRATGQLDTRTAIPAAGGPATQPSTQVSVVTK